MRSSLATRLCLVAIVLTFLASPALALDPVEPVAPEKPIPADVVQVFDEFFGPDIKAAQATPTLDDDGALAARIYEEANRRAQYPDFVACSLDWVVRLAGPIPSQQRLVYAALQVERRNKLRADRPCLEKMMFVGPRVAESLPREAAAQWITEVWIPDAMEYARADIAAGRWEAAWQALSAVRKAAIAVDAAVPQDVTDSLQAVEFARSLQESIAAMEKLIATESSDTRARTSLGIVKLYRDNDAAAAIEHFRAARSSAATEMADALVAAQSGRAPKDAVRVASAASALAEKTDVPCFQALLWLDVRNRCSDALASDALEHADRLRCEMMRDRAARRAAEAADKLPAPVRDVLLSPATQAVAGPLAGADFFGIHLKQAKRVVYIVDRSGSMTDSIMYVKYELKRSIKTLHGDDAFQVMFYSSGPPVIMPPPKLVPATEANKQKACEFVDSIVPVGQTDPSGAIEQAFALKPDAIYLLTDGQFDRKIAPLIRQLNADKAVVVNTIGFIYSNGEPMLQQIARENRGQYRYVNEDDLSGK